ncbi:hypothetical protein CTZ27_07115 [Streptomyces griseocarneus]|nr:hypothetical protein CTZ27_07115 [Streptomyces griseocarneus]
MRISSGLRRSRLGRPPRPRVPWWTGPVPVVQPLESRRAQRLNATSGRITVSALADDAGVRRRRLEALFREQVGVTPKALARILRFHRAFRLIVDGTRDTGLAAVAADCGCSDQSHLTREIRALSGSTPRRLHLRMPATGRAHSFKSVGQASP